MPVRRRQKRVEVQYRPPMPAELLMYRAGEWGAPPWNGTGSEWEAGHQAAYQRWLQAAAEWRNEHKHMLLDPSTVPPAEEPFCGEFDEHECSGADCPRRPVRMIVGLCGDDG